MKYQTLMHWKFRKLHKALGSESIAHTAGYLEVLWLHCQQPGNGPVLKADEVEAICDWQGEPRKLLRALQEVTLLDAHHGGEIVEVHDFADHCPGYVKKRDHRAEYMREYRKRAKVEHKEEQPPLPDVTQRNKLHSTVTDPTSPNLTLRIRETNVSLDEGSSTAPAKKQKQGKLPGTQRTAFKDRAAACGFWHFHNLYPENRKGVPQRILPLWEDAIKDDPEVMKARIMEHLQAMIDSGEYTKESGRYCPGEAKYFEDMKYNQKPIKTDKFGFGIPVDPDDAKPERIIKC